MSDESSAYAAPSDDRGGTVLHRFANEDEMVEATKPTQTVTAGVALTGVTGAVLALSALQLWLNFRIVGPARMVPFGMLVVAAAFFLIAAELFRLRVWAAFAAIGLGFAVALAGAVWFVVSLASGLLSLYGFALPMLSVFVGVLGLLSLGPAQRATAAREQLLREGIATDF